MLKVKNIFFILITTLILAGCKKDHNNDLFKSTGKDETRVRELSGFRDIEIFDKIDVYVMQGPNFEVKVEAGKNMHIGILTEIKDSVLMISNENKCNFVRSPKRSIKVYITAPHFKKFKNNGVGSIYSLNTITEDSLFTNCTNSGDIHLSINAKYFRSSSHGNGDLYLSGKTLESDHYLNGTNFIYANDFTIASRIFIETYSVGHCYIKAPQNGLFEASLWTRGNIYYTGDPATINYKKYDKGDIIKK